jgi:hypothetical protein
MPYDMIAGWLFGKQVIREREREKYFVLYDLINPATFYPLEESLNSISH